MKTVDKALKVLEQFSLERPELGLSELARLADTDKAATRRLLLAFSKHGFIEQSAETRKYRLGTGFLRLARIREATVPMARAAQEVVDTLLEAVDETVHISVPVATSMATIAHRLPRRGNVINIEPTEALPYHATSSGLVYLAFASTETCMRVLQLQRLAVTASTLVKKQDILDKLSQIRDLGYACSYNSFEAGVASIAMPFFNKQSDPAGAVSIALPDTHLTSARTKELLPPLRSAAKQMETALKGGE